MKIGEMRFIDTRIRRMQRIGADQTAQAEKKSASIRRIRIPINGRLGESGLTSVLLSRAFYHY